MSNGRARCEMMKDIRRAVARANNIDYFPSVCNFRGECDGTCPKCDEEVELLQRLLAEKEARGEKIIWPDVDLEKMKSKPSKRRSFFDFPLGGLIAR